MDHELPSTKFELPKSPAPTLHNDDSDDDDVEFVGTIAPPTGEWKWHPNQNFATAPPLLVTPPLSPLGMGVQQPNMPLLTAMLAPNNSAYPPQGYIVHIPCFLCKQPFNDIDRLREHLIMHAAQLNYHGRLAAVDAPNACPLPPPAGIEVNGGHSRLTKDMTINADPPAQGKERTEMHCDHCSKVFRSTMSLQAHMKQHRLPYEANNKWWSRKQLRCPICQKGYKRDSFLLKHMAYKHVEQLEQSRPECPPRPLRPAPAPAAAPAAERDQPKRCVYSTNLLNAVAAANYSPATESAAKYVPPTDTAQRQLDPCLKPPPKQKYALRSPYFNPNLWVDYDAYI
ncbi:zinc finger protein 384-like [Drosophila montana]|uniref:zinc finger protein 384-like n=1 Tax=Drosophila montana TaxID=40370 RepID=UPI00313A9706